MTSLKIGTVAKQAGVGIETIRYYEREGLIPSPPRRESGYREFPPSVVKRIKFIRHAKELGFSLAEIQELLSLRVDPDATQLQVREKTQAKIDEIEVKIHALERMKSTLHSLLDACQGDGPASVCPILDALD